MPSALHPIERPHCTIRGRVVYDRKIKLFTERDLARIGKAVVKQSSGGTGILYQILESLSLAMLQEILDIFGLATYKEVVLQFLLSIVGRLLGEVQTLFGNLFSENLSHLLLTQIMYYAPAEDRKKWSVSSV